MFSLTLQSIMYFPTPSFKVFTGLPVLLLKTYNKMQTANTEFKNEQELTCKYVSHPYMSCSSVLQSVSIGPKLLNLLRLSCIIQSIG